ncbi:sugar phosphate isomerase/epimerase [Candidatus Bathyarchaeota archaeon]|nr:sugar phosphate isomerase/epimerase [Candidatus Bathyarchaeota archaeon]
MGFKAIQIGPLTGYVDIEGERLRKALDSLKMERNVHVGGIFDAESLATAEREYKRVRKQIRGAATLCNEIVTTLVSVHPPFFRTTGEANDELLRKARTRFRRLLKDEVDFASRKNVKVALESFCYPPFIFRGLDEFSQFIEQFPPEKLGILMDAGHLYQAGIDLDEAVHLFKRRLLDIHVHDAMRDKDYREATHLPIGKGTIDFPRLIDLLRQVSYDGWLTLEVRGNEQELVRSREYLESLVGSVSRY